MLPIPDHLKKYDWYAPHQAWLVEMGYTPNPAGAVPKRADLRGANLRCADLRGADLRDVPIVPNIDSAILAAIEKAGCSLEMRSWHTCETTHCRAGWAITLAGEAGKLLEDRVGSSVAGVLIYAASRPGKPIPDFYTTNDEALADLRACAAEENAQ
jgi:uncharacterized protein YjbI with pentapeptide repeats